MSRLGMADLGLATFNDMVTNAAMIASLAPGVPVIADADTGYGGPIMVGRTVQAYARAGVAGLHIEDQVQEKRCGHLLGKQLVEREVYYSRLRAAVAARDAMGSDMLIIARTDARAGEGGFDEAVARLRGAVECGVDVLFLEALKSNEEAKLACETFSGSSLLLNMVPGGVTPTTTVRQAKDLGFRIIIFPCACLEAVVQSVTNDLKALREDDVINDKPVGIRRMFEICGLNEAMDIDKKAGGKAYDNV